MRVGRETYTALCQRSEAVSTQPLATYSERLLEVRCDFMLYKDRVVVQDKEIRQGGVGTDVYALAIRPSSRHNRRYRLGRFPA